MVVQLKMAFEQCAKPDLGAKVIAPKPICKSPFKSPLRYPGGKQRAVLQIAGMLPASMNEYREPMVGGGSVYFYVRNRKLARRYWINDKFEELIAFWTTVQSNDSCKKLMNELEELRLSCATAEKFKDYYKKVRDESPKDSYRAAFLFFFFNRVTFSGTTQAGGFSSAASIKRFTASAIERLRDMPEALSDTKITNLDVFDVIETPGEGVFVFIDPPYYTATRLYGKNGRLHQFDHKQLAAILKVTEHRFLITYDDCEAVRELYNWANIKDWQLQYGMNNCNQSRLSKVGNELFISNY